MDEKSSGKVVPAAHRITLDKRKAGSLTGVRDVLSFDEKEIVIETDCGMLTIKGEDLHIKKLMLEKGEAELEGRVDQLQYTEGSGSHRSGASWLGRLFN